MIMKIPGLTTALPSAVRILVITTVLCTASLISARVGYTLAESTSGRYESLQVKVDGLEVKATGRNTMDLLMNLLKNEKRWGILPINERF